jgi:hypothetical protein
LRNCVLTDTRSAAVTSSRHPFVQHRTRDNRVFHRLDSVAWRANVYLLCGETSERGQCTQQPHWRPAAAALQESLLGRRRHHVGGRLPAMVPTVARYDDLVNRRFKAELRAIPVHRGRTECRRPPPQIECGSIEHGTVMPGTYPEVAVADQIRRPPQGAGYREPYARFRTIQVRLRTCPPACGRLPVP